MDETMQQSKLTEKKNAAASKPFNGMEKKQYIKLKGSETPFTSAIFRKRIHLPVKVDTKPTVLYGEFSIIFSITFFHSTDSVRRWLLPSPGKTLTGSISAKLYS